MSGAGHSANRVLLVLLIAGMAAALGLAFVTQAPNRLVSGVGVPLRELLHGGNWALISVPAAVLALAAFLRQSAATHGLVAVAAAALLAALAWLAGAHAKQLSDAAEAAGNSAGRTSFGGGLWVLTVLCWLAAADAVQRLKFGALGRTLALGAVLAPVIVMAASGALDALSLFKEYDNRQDVFDAALWRHAQIVGVTLLPTLLIGVPLGVMAHRHPRFGTPVFALLNVIQTVPSIALFGLLMAPLAALAVALPALGIAGIGLAPAVIALALYSLLPIVQSTLTGLREVPAAAVEAATGMGLTPRQVFWRVQVPLALPLLLSGLRLTTVQAIGLAVVAALIGAGGLGAIMFQGLLSSALDLVLLGVLPVVAMAVGVDALFAVLTQWAQRRQP
ncbi:MAG TPA: ABC transporter permease [Ideonella sp.]|uniref:ABC transporter permease n=1 Tax=Ideonella sp. TaxID=1929293 RepID=UPI002C545C4C|nr:ABC transporter permease [Ideonella sp.]HSI48316.1 ABC transporter permease [Ideonella sp.]